MAQVTSTLHLQSIREGVCVATCPEEFISSTISYLGNETPLRAEGTGRDEWQIWVP